MISDVDFSRTPHTLQTVFSGAYPMHLSSERYTCGVRENETAYLNGTQTRHKLQIENKHGMTRAAEMARAEIKEGCGFLEDNGSGGFLFFNGHFDRRERSVRVVEKTHRQGFVSVTSVEPLLSFGYNVSLTPKACRNTL